MCHSLCAGDAQQRVSSVVAVVLLINNTGVVCADKPDAVCVEDRLLQAGQEYQKRHHLREKRAIQREHVSVRQWSAVVRSAQVLVVTTRRSRKEHEKKEEQQQQCPGQVPMVT